MATQPAACLAVLTALLVLHVHVTARAAEGPVEQKEQQGAWGGAHSASDRVARQDKGQGMAAHATKTVAPDKWHLTVAAKVLAAGELRGRGRSIQKSSRKGRGKRGGTKVASGSSKRPGAGNGSGGGGVQQVMLDEYDWREMEQSMEDLLEPALGPEVSYWRGRPSPVSCDDVAAEVVRLHAKSLVYIRAVLVRNNQWYFLDPGEDVGAARKKPAAVAGSRWPLLRATQRCSHYCHYQMSSLWLGITQLLDAARANTSAAAAYGLPDMVFVLNVADNSASDQHYGRRARAPLLSLLKKWDEPWWQASAAAAASDGGEGVTAAAGSLGRLPGGGLLQPMQLPSRVKERVAALAHPAERGGAAHTVAGSSSMALPLLEVQAGTAVESAAWEEARGSEDPLRELVRRFVARMPPAPAAPAADMDNDEDVKSRPRKPTGNDKEMDLLLPVMHYSAKSLSFFPWHNKTDKALFSGSAFREKYKTSHSPLNVRPYVGQLAAQYPDELDVRLRQLSRKATAPSVPIPEHARYRWLLSMDGVSASSRLGLLMGLDSVLLKSRSPYIEYYSRLQVPGVHHLEFWTDPTNPDDLLRVLAEARATARDDPAAVQAAVQANQAIAARYNARLPRQVYARAALLTYRELVPEMDECVKDLLLHMERTGHGLE